MKRAVVCILSVLLVVCMTVQILASAVTARANASVVDLDVYKAQCLLGIAHAPNTTAVEKCNEIYEHYIDEKLYSPSKNYIDLVKESWGLKAGLAIWQATTLVTEPSSIVNSKLERKDYYEGLIKSIAAQTLFNDENKLDDVFDATGYCNTIADELCKLLNLENKDQLVNFKDLKSLNAKTTFQEALGDFSPCDILDTVLSASETYLDAAERFAVYYSMASLDDYVKQWLQEMYNCCDSNTDDALVAALYNLKTSSAGFVQATYVHILDTNFRYSSWAAGTAIDKAVSAWTSSNPIAAAVVAGLKLGKTISDVCFGASDTYEQLFLLDCVFEIQTLMRAAVGEARADFVYNQTKENAKAFLTFVELYFEAIINTDIDCAQKYLYTLCTKGVLKNPPDDWKSWINQLEDYKKLRKSNYDSMMQCFEIAWQYYYPTVAPDHTAPSTSCNCSANYAGTYVCTTSSAPLTIRGGHGITYGAIGSIPSGATVNVIKANGSWAHVTYNGVTGYASMEYLQKKVTKQTEAVTVFSQYDSEWKNHPYGFKDPAGKEPATIGSGGCGILALVNAVYYMNGNFINPNALADWSVSNGYRKNGDGTYHSLYPNYSNAYGSVYGFSCTSDTGTSSWDVLTSHLQNGGTAIVPTSGIYPSWHSLAGRSWGHLLVIADYSISNDTYLVLDSSASSVRGTSSGYAWMTQTQFKSYMNYSKFILINNTSGTSGGHTSVAPQKPTITNKSYYYEEGGSATITWSAVSGNSYYWISIWKDGDLIVNQTMDNKTSYTMSNLTKGEYKFAVSANNSAGNSGGASFSFLVGKAPDKTEVSTDQTSYTVGDTITASWTAETGTTYYWINVYKDGELIVNKTMDLKTSYTIENAEIGEYKIAVSANNGAGNAGGSSVSFSVAKIGAPVITSSKTNYKTSQTVEISWDSVAGAVSYAYYLSEYPNEYAYTTNVSSGKVTSPKVTFSNLPNGRYSIFVCSVSEAGKHSSQSNWLTFYVYNSDYVPVKTIEHHGHIYALFDTEVSWDFAKILCSEMGGHLATVTSEQENTYITELISYGDKEAYWLGASNVVSGSYKTTGEPFKWITDEAFDYTNWKSGEPSQSGEKASLEHFLEVRKSYDNKWNDTSNTNRKNKGFILEVDTTVYNPTAVTSYGDSKYLLFDNSLPWTVAQTYCESIGGHLVSIMSEKEDEAVHTLVEQGQKAWYFIGASKLNGEWTWSDDGSILSSSYSNWSNSSSWGNYLMKYKGSGDWVGINNFYSPSSNMERMGFVCEINNAVFTVSYNANGGSSAPDEQRKILNEELVLSDSIPIREGYSFLGWSTNSDGTKAEYQAGDAFSLDADTILYAVWEKQEIDAAAHQIVVNGTKARPGGTVSVRISLKNNPGIASMRLKVDYDSSVMSLIEVADLGMIGSQIHSDQLTDPYVLCWANDTVTENFVFDGDIVVLKFKIIDGAAIGTYNISVSYDYDKYDIHNVQVEKVKFYTLDGTVDVVDVLPGDANGDGSVDTLDRLTLSRYLANWKGYTLDQLNFAGADVNSDGSVDTLDRLILSRHLANWSGYEDITNPPT